MTAKKFSSVFEKISLPSLLAEIFADCTVSALTINKSEKSINIIIESDEIISEQYIDAFKRELIEQIPSVKSVNVKIRYSRADNGQKIWENIVYSVSGISPICKSIMSDAVAEERDGIFVIRVKNNMSYYMSKKGIDKFITDKLFNENGISVKVMFKNAVTDSEEKEAIRLDNERKEREFIMRNISANAQDDLAEPSVEVHDDENKEVIIGKPIKSSATPILSLIHI